MDHPAFEEIVNLVEVEELREYPVGEGKRGARVRFGHERMVAQGSDKPPREDLT